MADSPSPAMITSISLPATDYASREDLFATPSYQINSDGTTQRLWRLLHGEPTGSLQQAIQPMADELVLPGVECAHVKVTPHGSFAWVPMTVGSGENKRKFQGHHGMLSHHSTVFEEALRDDPDNFGSLPDQNPDIFKIVIDWIYARGVWDKKTGKKQQTALNIRQALLVYFCAVKHGMTLLQNETLSLIYHMTAKDLKLLVSQGHFIYKETEPRTASSLTSPLHRFLLDAVVSRWCFADGAYILHDQLLQDTLAQLQILRRAPGTYAPEEEWIRKMNKNFCSMYHQHHEAMDNVEDDPNYSDDADEPSATGGSSDDSGSSSDSES